MRALSYISLSLHIYLSKKNQIYFLVLVRIDRATNEFVCFLIININEEILRSSHTPVWFLRRIKKQNTRASQRLPRPSALRQVNIPFLQVITTWICTSSRVSCNLGWFPLCRERNLSEFSHGYVISHCLSISWFLLYSYNFFISSINLFIYKIEYFLIVL